MVDSVSGPEGLTDAELALLRDVFELVRDGNTDRIAELLPVGLPVNLTNSSGDTLLLLAAYHHHAELVSLLLAHDADTGRVNDRGQTALGAAVFRRSAPIVRALVAAGADPDLGPQSARAVATFFDLPEMAALLDPPPPFPEPVEGPPPEPLTPPEPVEGPQLARLARVMSTLRTHCPWDASQTHRSLVQYLLEETLEVVEAIETGSVTDLREELGDLLLQVYFHAQIASEDPAGFDLEDVARGIADKLVDRHPHVFGPSTGSGGVGGGDAAVLDALNVSWEARKAAQKGRTSVLEGIPEQLSALARATKIISRARARGVEVSLPTGPVDADALGADVLQLVARAQANGIDAEQAVRDAVRRLEATVLDAEARARETRPPEATDGPR